MNAYTAGLKLAEDLGHAPYKPGTVAAMNRPGSVVSKLADFVEVSEGTQAGRRRAAISLAFTLSDRRHALAELLAAYDSIQAEKVQLTKDWEDVADDDYSAIAKLEIRGDDWARFEAALLPRFVALLREV